MINFLWQLQDIPQFPENFRILLESSEGLAYLHGGNETGRTAVTHCDVKRYNHMHVCTEYA